MWISLFLIFVIILAKKPEEKKINVLSPLVIPLYGIAYTYKYKHDISVSYKKDKIIYANKEPKSALSRKKIAQEILLIDLKILMGQWEERLGCIIDKIYLTNFKTKSFQICPQDSAIAFSNKLMIQSFAYIEFIVAKACFEYIGIGVDRQEELLQQCVNDWKHSNKVYTYERSIRN